MKTKPRLAERLVLIGLFVWAIATVIVPIKVEGRSMAPTYRPGSSTALNRLAYVGQTPQRGDVVVIRDDDGVMVKRIIAVPGETVELRGGVFYVNGKPDMLARGHTYWSIQPVRLGGDQYYVIGDNREESVFGAFRSDQILGKVIF